MKSLVLFFSLMPALFWALVYLGKDKNDPEPRKAILLTFLLGALGAAPFWGLAKLLPLIHLPSFLNYFITFFVFALFEEITKISSAIMAIRVYKNSFNQIKDGVIYAAVAALGFSFVENGIYFWPLITTESLDTSMLVIAVRSLGTMLAHTLFSSLVGLIWAYAYFSKKISPYNTKGILSFTLGDFFNLELISFHIIRKNILSAHPSRRGGHEKKTVLLEGLLVATLFHTFYNALTAFEVGGHSMAFLIIPLVVSGFAGISYLLTRKYYNHIYKVI